MSTTEISNLSLKDLVISQDNTIDIRDCYVKTGIETILEQLDQELVGLESVKTRVREISSVLLFDRIREIQELPTLNSSLHMSFTGTSGTGKTSVAENVALVLRNLGYLSKGHITNVTREDLVGQYVGHTAPKTKEKLQEAHGGILFIDEAHHLYKPDNERDYGSEAIEILLQVMENQRDDLVVIFAGYKERMDSFYESNPGLSSRVANHIDFPDYTPDELIQIGRLILEEQQYRMTDAAEAALFEYVQKRSQLPLFANARTISNAIDTARMRHANRMFNSGDAILTKSDLVKIESPELNIRFACLIRAVSIALLIVRALANSGSLLLLST
jgi:probable Rubsico expression protein CbbX